MSNNDESRARVGKGEVEGADLEMRIFAEYHNDYGCFPDEHGATSQHDYIAFKRGYKAALASKPVEVGEFDKWWHDSRHRKINPSGPMLEAIAREAWQASRTTDTELTRLKRQVEALREGLEYYKGIKGTVHHVQPTNIDTASINEVYVIGTNLKAIETLAAADRIAKGEV